MSHIVGSALDDNELARHHGRQSAAGGDLLVKEVEVSFGGNDATSRRSDRAESFVALDNISLHVGQGQFVALVGASGCGKTTLLNLFAGLLEPTRGEVLVAGAPPHAGNLNVGYMFARDGLLPWRTARRNVELGLERIARNRAERRERARAMLKMVHLGEFEDRYPRKLSQGMRQRVALARTLAPDPNVVLMDEPFAALDAQTKLRLQTEFLRIWEEASATDRKTVLFVTHDLQEALLLADRVIVMLPNPGRVAVDSAVDLPRPRYNKLGSVMFSKEFRSLHENLFKLLDGNGPQR